MAYHLNEKVILITGASGGIGFACAKAFYEQGAKLVLTDLSTENLKKQVKENNFDEDRILLLELNVIDKKQTKSVIEQTITHFGKLDIVFANAGIAASPPKTFLKMSETEFEHVVEVDLFGVSRVIKASLPEIIKNKGQVIITSSAYSFFNGIFNTPYATSKAAIEMLGRSLRSELAYTGATAMVLYPGWVDTPITKVVFGGDDTATKLANLVIPSYFLNPVPPKIIAEALLKGIKKRSHRVFSPKRWGFMWFIQTILTIFGDSSLGKNKKVQKLIEESDRK
ncbi:SDR family NAD(P)-dependent oxidoreductase [Bernardetia sp. ABR2-2B]|uniref:SDR family NAD(P)-dependent oxidoreductase n=1 Tax=Bernardetia sp. ABR2-2B TaxID=3127472 RepID=UPI0030D43B16